MRPVEWSPEVLEQAKAYLNDYDTTHSHSIPSVVGLCQVINRARSTVYKWAKEEDKGFSDILEAINEKQQMVLLSKGLTGDFNAQITKLVLGKHGYHDRQETEVSGPNGGPIQVSKIELVAFDGR
jgi:hypothetical protein